MFEVVSEPASRSVTRDVRRKVVAKFLSYLNLSHVHAKARFRLPGHDLLLAVKPELQIYRLLLLVVLFSPLLCRKYPIWQSPKDWEEVNHCRGAGMIQQEEVLKFFEELLGCPMVVCRCSPAGTVRER